MTGKNQILLNEQEVKRLLEAQLCTETVLKPVDHVTGLEWVSRGTVGEGLMLTIESEDRKLLPVSK